jgi:hypothetical protein
VYAALPAPWRALSTGVPLEVGGTRPFGPIVVHRGITPDPARTAPRLLWAAVRRSVDLDDEQRTIDKAGAHSALDDLVAASTARVEKERVALFQSNWSGRS